MESSEKLFFGEVLNFYRFLCYLRIHYFQKVKMETRSSHSTVNAQQTTSKAMAKVSNQALEEH